LLVFAMSTHAADQKDDAAARARQLLAQEAASVNNAEVSHRLASNRHIDAGKKLLADLEYELAYKQFQQALAEDPRNGDARKLLEQVEALMGVHRSRMRTTVE